MQITDYFDKNLVSFLDVDTRDETLDHMIDLLESEGKLPDKKAFRDAILYREGLVSTGIGMGIAIPHAKLRTIDHFFISIAIQKKQGIEWNSLDKAPVRIVFMIGGPDTKQSEYLKILSMLTTAIKNPEVRKKLLKANSSQQVVEIFSDI